jgi:hypothetical protein
MTSFFQIAGAVFVGNLMTLAVYLIIAAKPKIIGWSLKALVLAFCLVGAVAEVSLIIMGFQDYNYWIAWGAFSLCFGGIMWFLKRSGALGSLFGMEFDD